MILTASFLGLSLTGILFYVGRGLTKDRGMKPAPPKGKAGSQPR